MIGGQCFEPAAEEVTSEESTSLQKELPAEPAGWDGEVTC